MTTLRLENLRIRQLKFLNLLASLGSLAATAEHLSMTPSAASMMLKEIEGIFHTKLFVRRGKGMELTEQGRTLLPRCQTVLGEVGAMHASLSEQAPALLRIGAFPHTVTTVLPDIVNRLIAGPLHWRIQIVEERADRLVELLLTGEVDLMLGRMPRKMTHDAMVDSLAQRMLYQGGLVVVCRAQHPLASQPALQLQALLDWPWVLPSKQSTTRIALIDAFLRQGLTPPLPLVEVPSYVYGLSLLEHSDLLTCCAHSTALQDDPRFAILPVTIGLDATPVSLIWRKNSAEALRAVAQLGHAAAPAHDASAPQPAAH